MFRIAIIPALALLTACAAPPLERMNNDEMTLNAELAARVAGPPQNCLPGYRTDDMRAVGENRIVVRDGSTLFVSETDGSCRSSTGGRALVIKRISSSNLCRGDIAQVVDLQSGAFHGSCSFGDFVPYRKP